MTEIFEYALVRVVPRVERGEAINVGVIVYSQAYRYLCARIELDERRLLAVDPAVDLDAVRTALSAFEKACTEGPWRAGRWVSGSAGSPHPGRPSSSPAPCTAASPPIPPPS